MEEAGGGFRVLSVVSGLPAGNTRGVQLLNGELDLSPLDLSAYLACPHLTTLESRSRTWRSGTHSWADRVSDPLPVGAPQ